MNVFDKEENFIRRWWLELAYFSPMLALYRKHSNGLLYYPVDWFLFNGNTDLKLEVGCMVEVNVNL